MERLIVCTPGTNWSRAWRQGWDLLYGRLLHEYNFKVEVIYASGNNVYGVRGDALELIADRSRENPPKHVLWIDDDNVVSPEGFFALRHALDTVLEASAVGAWYVMEPKGGEDAEITAGKNGKRPTPEAIQAGNGDLLEVDYLGFGFLLMKYSMLDQLGLGCFNAIINAEGQMETDDVSFCIRAREAGHRLFLHSGVHSPHLKLMPIPLRRRRQESRVVTPIPGPISLMK